VRKELKLVEVLPEDVEVLPEDVEQNFNRLKDYLFRCPM